MLPDVDPTIESSAFTTELLQITDQLFSSSICLYEMMGRYKLFINHSSVLASSLPSLLSTHIVPLYDYSSGLVLTLRFGTRFFVAQATIL